MGVWRSVKWSVAWGCIVVTSSAAAQTGGYPTDPRGASKAAPYQYPQQPYPAQNSGYGYNPVQPPAARPVAPQPPQPPQPPARYGAPQPQFQQARPKAHSYVLAPPVLPYYEGAEAPEGYVLDSHRNHGLMIGGGVTWAAAYGAGLVYAMGKSFDNGTGWLAVPLIGPWGAISGRDFRCQSSQNVTQKEIDTCVDGALSEITSITFLAMMGMVQAVGATLFFVGIGDTTERWLRADVADVEVSADTGQVGDSGYGLVLSGTF